MASMILGIIALTVTTMRSFGASQALAWRHGDSERALTAATSIPRHTSIPRLTRNRQSAGVNIIGANGSVKEWSDCGGSVRS